MPEFFLRAVRRLAALALLWPLLQPSASAQASPDGLPLRDAASHTQENWQPGVPA